jgi:muramoyltetrapeptide carboxypeptidase
MVTFAGPMASYDFGAVAPSPYTLENCFGILGSDEWVAECALDGPSRVACSGTLWGGNLAMVAHLAGTPYLPDIDGGILFLEDVNEHPYRVERMLLQLHQAGVLGKQQAVLLGDFSNYKLGPGDNGYDFDSMLAFVRASVGVPVLCGLEYGHGRRRVTIPCGAPGA